MSAEALRRLHQQHESYVHESFLIAIAIGKGVSEPKEFHERLEALMGGLNGHFAEEETAMFPWLLQHLPEEAPSIQTLVDEHAQLGLLLRELKAAKARERPPADPETISIVKRFIRLLDSHTAREQMLVARVPH